MDQTPDRSTVLAHLDKVLASPSFRRAERSRALLRFIVEQGLDGRLDRLKEYTLGAEALGRGESFDPRTDPIVRAEAGRLRARLDQYYETAGRADTIRLTLPKGSYLPQFAERDPSVEVGPSRRSLRSLVPWILAAAGFASAFLVWLGHRSPAPIDRLAQFDVELKSDGLLGSDVGTDVVLSPDASRVVFVSRSPNGRTHLNTRRLDQPDAVALPDTDGARVPFVSPDGQWVGFWADGKLRKTSVAGGSPVILCDATDVLGAAWGDGDTIVMASEPFGKLWRVPSAGGAPRVAIDLSAENTTPRWPQVLPGGRLVLYTAITDAGADRGTIEVLDIDGGSRKVLVRNGTFGRYLTSGHLLYVNQGTLYAVRFDLDTLAVGGPPLPVLNDVMYSPLFGYAQVDVSQTGTLVWRKGAESGFSVVDWIDRSGERSTLLAERGRYGWPRLSPDGGRLALTEVEGGVGSIRIHEVGKGQSTRITTRSGAYSGLTWSGDGAFVFFGGPRGLECVGSDGAGESKRLTDANVVQVPWALTRDGRRLAYYERNPKTGFDTMRAHLATDRDGPRLYAPEALVKTPAFEVYASFSPDGQWLVYASNESGNWEIYVRHFPDNGSRVRVSNLGGVVPRWSPNGRELLYRTDRQQVMVVPYRVEGGAFVAETPRPWSPHKLADTGVLPNFDVAPDGDRIAALMPAPGPGSQQTANHVTFMINFGREIERRASTP